MLVVDAPGTDGSPGTDESGPRRSIRKRRTGSPLSDGSPEKCEIAGGYGGGSEGQPSVIRPGMVLSCNLADHSGPMLVKTIAKVPRWKEWWDVEFLSDQNRCQLELPASAMGTLWKVAEQDIGGEVQSGVGGGGDGGVVGGGVAGGAQTLTLSTSRADLVELLACSKLGLFARCEANGLETNGNKNILLMRLIDFYSVPQKAQEDGGNNGSSGNKHKRSCRGEGGIGVGRHQLEGGGDEVPVSQGGKQEGARTGGDPVAIVAPSTSMLSLGKDCMVRVLQMAVGSPLPDWREMFPKLSQFAMVCTKFRDASRELCSPILAMGSIRDWPARKQIPLIEMMCARRQKLTELSLTLVDEVEMPLLLLLLLKCDVSSLKIIKLISSKGQPDLFWDRILRKPDGEEHDIESAEGLDRLSADFRMRTCDECFASMAESMGVNLPRSDLFSPNSTYGLTLALQCCPALSRLDIVNFRPDASCFDALSGCIHLSYLNVRSIPGDLTQTSIEKWRGHRLASLIVYNQGHYGSVLTSLIPVLRSLTSFKIGCKDPDRGQLRQITLRSESLRHLTIVCKVRVSVPPTPTPCKSHGSYRKLDAPTIIMLG